MRLSLIYLFYFHVVPFYILAIYLSNPSNLSLPGALLHRLLKGAPPKPDRLKDRKNPYRETLVWKLDGIRNTLS